MKKKFNSLFGNFGIEKLSDHGNKILVVTFLFTKMKQLH